MPGEQAIWWERGWRERDGADCTHKDETSLISGAGNFLVAPIRPGGAVAMGAAQQALKCLPGFGEGLPKINLLAVPVSD